MINDIDLILTGAKIAALGNEPASLAIHGASAAYNIGQMAQYRVLYLNGQTALQNGKNLAAMALTEQYRREMIKHTILSGVDIATLLLIGITGLRRNE